METKWTWVHSFKRRRPTKNVPNGLRLDQLWSDSTKHQMKKTTMRAIWRQLYKKKKTDQEPYKKNRWLIQEQIIDTMTPDATNTSDTTMTIYRSLSSFDQRSIDNTFLPSDTTSMLSPKVFSRRPADALRNFCCSLTVMLRRQKFSLVPSTI